MNLNYFDIAWMSGHDGPGKRVVLYLQQCHLRCQWCHAPRSCFSKPGAPGAAGAWTPARTRCTGWIPRAISWTGGNAKTADNASWPARPLTLSGGEALLQYKAVRELLALCREKAFHTAVETSGTLPLHIYKYVADQIGVMSDGKLPNGTGGAPADLH